MSDWPVKTLAELGGRVTSGSRGWAAYYADHGDLFVRITNLRRDSIKPDLSDCRFVQIDSDEAEARRTRLRAGDLLISITADIGIIGYVGGDFPRPAYINQHIARVRLDPKIANSKFVAYYLASWAPQRKLVGSTDQGAKAGMNLATVANLTTPLPDSAEQDRIADALSDVDASIQSLERQVVKKRAIKQGMMQELLTGRTRLPGFTEPWAPVRLSGLGEFLRGRGVTRDQVRPSGVPCIRYGELYTTYTGYTASTVSFVESSVAASALPIHAGDILFAGSGETKEEIGTCVAYIGNAPAVAGGDIIVLRGAKYEPVYLASLLNTPALANRKARGGQGDAVVHINWRVLAGLEVDLPELPEQRAIADVLRDADHELDALGRRLEAARAIKQGMMQELLTGRTRLVPTEASA